MAEQQPSSPDPSPLRWYFARPGPVQRQRNSKLDDHFAGSGSDRAGDLGREGTQNAGDAAGPSGGPVRIRIGFGELPAARATVYGRGLADHVPALAKQKGMSALSAVTTGASCPFLSFEDFNTTGLTGDPHAERRYDGDPANAFHTFFRAEGQTDKVSDSKQGSHGIGKVAFMSASHARAVIGLTCRHDDARELLFGTAVLHTHRHDGKDFDGDAWFGRQSADGRPVEPAEDAATLNQFREDFELARKAGEAGFSVVVPWLDQEEVTPDRVIDSVLRGHALPILRGELVVEISGGQTGPVTTIDAAHFLEVLKGRADAALKSQVRPMAELASWALAHHPTVADTLGLHESGAPRWSSSTLMSAEQRDRLRAAFDAGEPVALRVPVRVKPKNSSEVASHFDVFLCREPAPALSTGATVQFVRGGLLIAGMSRRLPGVRGLVIVDEGGLAGMLRAAENPSHTRWNAKALKDRYFPTTSVVSFVVDAAREITKLLAGDPAEKDASIWANEMSIPSGDLKLSGPDGSGPGSKHGKDGKKKKGTTLTPPPPPPPPPPKRPYDVLVIAGGFAVRPSGRPFDPPLNNGPAKLQLQLAYHVRGKNPLTRWNRNDFDLSPGSAIQMVSRGCTIEMQRDNSLVLSITAEDFELSATGFDMKRELFCRPRLRKEDPFVPPDSTEIEEATDEEELAELAGVDGGVA